MVDPHGDHSNGLVGISRDHTLQRAEAQPEVRDLSDRRNVQTLAC